MRPQTEARLERRFHASEAEVSPEAFARQMQMVVDRPSSGKAGCFGLTEKGWALVHEMRAARAAGAS